MTNYIKSIIAIIIIFSMGACTKDADIEISDNEPQVVVATFISPQSDSIALKVSLSAPVYYNNSDSEIDNSKVSAYVSNGGINYNLTYNDYSSTFFSDAINFNAGDNLKFYLNYKGEDFSSECTIPAEPKYDFEYLGSEVITSSNGFEESFHKIKITCNNNSDINYYRINAVFFNSNAWQANYTKYSNELYELQKGEIKTIRIYGDYSLSADSMKVFIVNCDEHYYKYHKNLGNYYDDGPFTEPIIMYNNIEGGGLGVFSSYNMKVEKFEINK